MSDRLNKLHQLNPRSGLLLITLGFLGLSALQFLPFVRLPIATSYCYAALMALSLLAFSIFKWHALRDFRLIIEPFFVLSSGFILGLGSAAITINISHVFFLVGAGFILSYLLWLSDLKDRFLLVTTMMFTTAASLGLMLPILIEAIPLFNQVGLNNPSVAQAFGTQVERAWLLADTSIIIMTLWLLMIGMLICRSTLAQAVENAYVRDSHKADLAIANQPRQTALTSVDASESPAQKAKAVIALDALSQLKQAAGHKSPADSVNNVEPFIEATNDMASEWSQALKKVAVELSFERNLPHVFLRLFEIAHTTISFDAALATFVQDDEIISRHSYETKDPQVLRQQQQHKQALENNLTPSRLATMQEKRTANTVQYSLDKKTFYQLSLPVFSKSELAAVICFSRQRGFATFEIQYLSSLLFHAVLAFRMGQMTKLLAKNRLQPDDVFSGIFKPRQNGVFCQSAQDFVTRSQALFANSTQPHPEVSMIFLKVCCKNIVQSQAAKDAVVAAIKKTLKKTLPVEALAGVIAQNTYAVTLPQSLMHSQVWAETLNSHLIDQLNVQRNQLPQMPEVNIGLASTTDMQNGLHYLMKHAEEGLLMAQQQHGSVISVSL